MKEPGKTFYQLNVLLIAVIVFAGIYGLISLVNHYVFRTYALDLGLYTNALFDYIRFQANDSSVFKFVPEHLLADHFDLHLMVLSPLSLLFGSYTLLLVQIIAILFGGYGVFAYISRKTDNHWIPVFAAIYFYSFFGVFSALSFDYHSNVTAACLIPWLFYYVDKQNIRASIILFIAIIIAKENMALWLTFVLLGMAWMNRKSGTMRAALPAAALLSGILFIFITQVIMPAFSNEGSYPHFKYAILGNSMFEAALSILKHPADAVKYLFVQHSDLADAAYIKAELHLILLISGLYFLLVQPIWLFMLIPVYAQKLYHNDPTMWGVGSQYAIEFAPILSLGIFTFIAQTKAPNHQRIFIFMALAGCLTASIRIMDKTELYTDKNRIRFYKKEHYIRHYHVNEVHKVLKTIPSEAIVSAQSPFLPHLALRDKVYQFPIIKDAEYIVVSGMEKPWPLSQEQFRLTVDSLKMDNNRDIIYESETILVFKTH